jgi:hypothetical protein
MFAVAGAIAAVAIAIPAFAGQADRRASTAAQREQTTSSERRAVPRDEPRQATPPARPSTPPQVNAPRPPAPQDRTSPTGPPARPDVQGRAVPRPPADVRPPDRDVRPSDRDARPSSNGRPGYNNGRPGHYDGRPGYYNPPRRVTRFVQPYFVFRPQVRLSFGLFVGYPVAYSGGWYDPYYRGRYIYAAPGVRYGGVSFDIDPYDASIFIDGNYVGVVDDFSPYEAPLTLRAGVHRVELRARGCQPMVFDITVVPGQVIPYRGTLAYGR